MNTENQYIVHLTPHNKTSLNPNSNIFKDIIGQEEAKKKLSFFANSHTELTPTPTFLFTGSQGLGKSYMANKMAKTLDRELVEVNCGSINTSKDFVEKILFGKVMGNTNKTLLLDEAHKLSPEITTILLSLLNPNEKNVNFVSYSNLMIEYDFTKINTILATTDAYKVFKPLLNRCVEIYFQLYTNSELIQILRHYLPGINLSCELEDLAYACRGRARDAFLLSQNIKRYCVMNKINSFDNNGWNDVKNIFSIQDYGLNSYEVRLMKAIRECGSISSNNLAVKLGVSVQNIESELEIRARELGFIDNTPRGRVLTNKGTEYLKNLV